MKDLSMPWFCSKVTDVMMMDMAGLTNAVHGQSLGLTTIFAHSCSSPADMECVFLHPVLEAKLTSSILQEETPLEVTMGVKGVFSVMQVIVKAGVNMRAKSLHCLAKNLLFLKVQRLTGSWHWHSASQVYDEGVRHFLGQTFLRIPVLLVNKEGFTSI